MQQLDASSGYRDRIERDVAARAASAPSDRDARAAADAVSVCAGCGTRNDADARFCKNCGSKL
jgi:rRNA maturation endonuclease Nob1